MCLLSSLTLFFSTLQPPCHSCSFSAVQPLVETRPCAAIFLSTDKTKHGNARAYSLKAACPIMFGCHLVETDRHLLKDQFGGDVGGWLSLKSLSKLKSLSRYMITSSPPTRDSKDGNAARWRFVSITI